MATCQIPLDVATNLYRSIAKTHGASEDEANVFSRCLLNADMRGHSTQGMGLLPYLSEIIGNQEMSFGRDVKVLEEAASTAALDGQQGVGFVGATSAMDMAIAKAQDTGIGLVTLRNSGDCGMIANFSIQAQEQGLIGIAMTTGPLLVAPWGGRDCWFSTNPLSLAVPTGTRPPIVVDMATSAYSMGNVVLAARDKQKLDTPAIVNSDGEYTNDPATVILDVLDRESQMAGALLPAGPRGFGMQILVEILAGLLSGAREWSNEAPSTSDSRPAYYGQFLLAIKIENFMPRETFLSAADRMIDTLINSRPAKGFDRVRLHGIEAEENIRLSRKNGIKVREEEWDIAKRTAKNLGLEF